jgi:transaldolase
MSDYKGKLHETVCRFPSTDIWNDSCAKKELEYALERGAVGATTNPIIVADVIRQEMDLWTGTIKKLVEDMPAATEDDIAWKLIEIIGEERAKMLLPIFEKYKGKKGRLSMQTNPKFYRNTNAMVEQAIHFNTLGKNIQVKMPVSEAGIRAIEEATFLGVSINATVSFTLPQAIAVAEAVERGLRRRTEQKLPVDEMAPICTIMIGRTDDWLKAYCNGNDVVVNPECLEWAGVAVFKKAYKIFMERGYRTRLLTAAYRNHYHWSALVGGECSMTIPHAWQVKINESSVEVADTIDIPVKKEYLDELYKLPEFIKAYEEDGLNPEEFVRYGAFQVTIRKFIEGYEGLLETIRKIMIY